MMTGMICGIACVIPFASCTMIVAAIETISGSIVPSPSISCTMIETAVSKILGRCDVMPSDSRMTI